LRLWEVAEVGSWRLWTTLCSWNCWNRRMQKHIMSWKLIIDSDNLEFECREVATSHFQNPSSWWHSASNSEHAHINFIWGEGGENEILSKLQFFRKSKQWKSLLTQKLQLWEVAEVGREQFWARPCSWNCRGRRMQKDIMSWKLI
jgi:hypothetical protein